MLRRASYEMTEGGTTKGNRNAGGRESRKRAAREMGRERQQVKGK